MDHDPDKEDYIATYFPDKPISKRLALWAAIVSCLREENVSYYEIKGVAKDGKTPKVDIWATRSKIWHQS